MPPLMTPSLMMPHFEGMTNTFTPMGNGGFFQPIIGGLNSLSDMNQTSATTRVSQSQFEESERKNKAKIELLEKKIRAKDQLFDDALASTVASVCGCGSSASENKSLTTELKKRFLKLKTRYEEAEREIQRLIKTVKIVEVEVREDTETFREEISKLN